MIREETSYPIRVLLVESSALALTLLKRALFSIPTLQIVGSTQNPQEAVALVVAQDPQVICVGLHLPDMDGRTFVQAVMEQLPRPILVVGRSLREGDSQAVLRLFEEGALDLFLEPLAWQNSDGEHFSRELAGKIQLLARLDTLPPLPVLHSNVETCFSLPEVALPAVNMVVLGAGLGGPSALREILAALPVHFPVPVLCIVHIHPALRDYFPHWLAAVSQMPVQVATHGEMPMPGSVYLPPNDQHLLVDTYGRLATAPVLSPVSSTYAVSYGVGMPSITVAMESAASYAAPVVIGVLLSGTGEDGARGLEAIASAGGYTMALDGSSAMAFDLPARLLEMGSVRHLLPCSVMADALLTLVGQSEENDAMCDTANRAPAASPRDRRGSSDRRTQCMSKPNGRRSTDTTVLELPTGQELLIVEDSPTQALKLRRFLQSVGFLVVVAKDGVEGLEMVKKLRPRLVLSDVSMPRMDGFELCRTIKNDPSLKMIPVILLTALTNPEEILEGLAAGADNYLTKPWEEMVLLEHLRGVLAVHGSQNAREDVLEIRFANRSYNITSSRRQVLDLLMATYQKAVKQNKELMDNHLELKMLNSRLVDQTSRLEITNQTLQAEVAERIKIEQKQASTLRDLQSANQELNDFAYIIAHDLKAPFRAIGSLTSWLLSDFLGQLDTDGQELVKLLHGRAERLNGLIDALLQYVRVTRIDETLQEVDLNALVNGVIRALSPPEEMEISLETPLPRIRFEPKRAEQLFHSLLDNAIRYMDKSIGIVRISLVSEDADWWQFSVADNGPGIDGLYFDKIFGVFQTLQARDQMESSGMGLALARKIVNKFGGAIWVTSQLGTGSAFYFTLPKNPEEDLLWKLRESGTN